MIEDAVAQIRARLTRRGAAPSTEESLETRLALACQRGKGHLVVTGPDAAAIDQLLARVVEKVAPTAVLRARAAEPAGGLDPLLSLVAGSDMPKAHLERRQALEALITRAAESDKAVLVVVEDAEKASVEQLDRLRATLEAAPRALDSLRMVLIGDAGLSAKLHSRAGRSFGAHIASHVRLDEAPNTDTDSGAAELSRIEDSRRSYALTLAAATCVAFAGAVYLSAFLSGAKLGRGRTIEDVGASVDSKDFAIAVGAPIAEGPGAAMLGAAAPFTPAFAIPAPRPSASSSAPSAPKSATKPVVRATASTTSGTPTKTAAASKPAPAAAQKAGAKKAPAPPARSSISSFMQRFE